MFDWPAFLRQHRIEFVSEGKDNIAVRCPFCRDDPSQHMGISLRGRGWHCWRNPSGHSGKSRARLIAGLLGCSAEQANRLAYGERALPADEDLISTFRAKLGMQTVGPPRNLELPRELKPLMNYGSRARPFRMYLHSRGYTAQQIEWLVVTYELCYALRGDFRYRIVMPVRDRDRKLLTLTGRSIIKGEELRYYTMAKEQAVCATKETLFALPLLWRCDNPKALLVCEGPFDAMWITLFGHSFGVYATCLFGLSLSMGQAGLLSELRSRFAYIGLLLDSAANFQAFKMQANTGIELHRLRLPANAKDPADLPPQKVIDLCLSVI